MTRPAKTSATGPASITIDVLIEAEGWNALPDPQALFERAAAKTLATTGSVLLDGAELSVLLSGDAALRALNRRWRGKDKATNVLSFPAVSADRLASSPSLGDIALGFETVRDEAMRDQKSFSDHAGHLFVHGLLHILGHDHQVRAEAETMEALEIRILAGLGIANPYADTDLIGMMGENG